eukprot:snap_masked-scaffold_21-processed-gene-0.25-mRNA-1 protein AED:1.00 eAED:1.00 QI:0/0/0/0/1/1/2/0/226
MSIYEKFPPTEKLTGFVVNEYFRYMDENDIPASIFSINFIEVSDKTKLKHIKRRFSELACSDYHMLLCDEPGISIIWTLKCTLYSHLKELSWTNISNDFIAQSILVDPFGIFIHWRTLEETKYENCCLVLFSKIKEMLGFSKENQQTVYRLKTKDMFYIPMEDIRVISESHYYDYSFITKDYLVLYSNNRRVILTPDVLHAVKYEVVSFEQVCEEIFNYYSIKVNS